jgi:hypothetical protein
MSNDSALDGDSRRGRPALHPPAPGRRWLRRLRRVGVGIAALLFAGALLEQVGAEVDRHRFPPQGTAIDLGDGRRMYLDCRGSGSPTVILDAGFRNWSPTWTLVQPQIAEFTRVCSYDRPGLGLSDRGPRPRNVSALEADLVRLLVRANVSPPYVLVGHSAGGMYHRVFAASHREQVTGMVLVDSDEPTDEEDRRNVERAGSDWNGAIMLTAMTVTVQG